MELRVDPISCEGYAFCYFVCPLISSLSGMSPTVIATELTLSGIHGSNVVTVALVEELPVVEYTSSGESRRMQVLWRQSISNQSKQPH